MEKPNIQPITYEPEIVAIVRKLTPTQALHVLTFARFIASDISHISDSGFLGIKDVLEKESTEFEIETAKELVEPTLPETFEWLKGKLIGSTSDFDNSEEYGFFSLRTWKCSDISFENCEFQFNIEDHYVYQDGNDKDPLTNTGVYTVHETFKGKFSDLVYTNISFTPEKNGSYLLSINTYNNKNVIELDTDRMTFPPVNGKQLMDRVTLYVQSENLTQRIAKAFSYVIKACGGKAEIW